MHALDQSEKRANALDQSAALLRRGDLLRSRSERIRAIADEKVEMSRRRHCRPLYVADGVTSLDLGAGDSSRAEAERTEALFLESRALRQMSIEARARAQAIRDQARQGRSRHEILRDSAFARLFTKSETMPTIEQAKGVIMAQQRCGPEEAFDLLRRASQRANIKVSALAAQIVAHVASPQPRRQWETDGAGRRMVPGATNAARPPAR